jgi:uncharacterized protein
LLAISNKACQVFKIWQAFCYLVYDKCLGEGELCSEGRDAIRFDFGLWESEESSKGIGWMVQFEELLKERREEILGLADRYGARNVRVFGSVARGEGGSASDIDFLVDMESGRTLLDHVGFRQDLEDLLGCPVDVVSAKALHWYIRDRILQEAVPL